MRPVFLTLPAFFTLAACGADVGTAAETPVATPVPAAETAEADPLLAGKKLFARCRACHTLEDGGRHKVGPNLWAVYGSTAGTKEGYAYSKAMRGSGVVWTDETMDAYIARPSAYMPGNKMSFVGLKKPEQRAALQAYLKRETGATD